MTIKYGLDDFHDVVDVGDDDDADDHDDDDDDDSFMVFIVSICFSPDQSSLFRIYRGLFSTSCARQFKRYL